MARERGAANDNYSRLPAPIASLGKAALLLPRRIRRRGGGFPTSSSSEPSGRRPRRSTATWSRTRRSRAPGRPRACTTSTSIPSRASRWYRAHFPVASGRAGRSSGEGAPYYLFHPLVPAGSPLTLPDVRVIAILRDPVERAYSQYKQEYARGFEDSETFEQALELEPERLEGEEERMVEHPGYQSYSHQHHSYVARGHVRRSSWSAWREARARRAHARAHRPSGFRPIRSDGMTRVFEFLGLDAGASGLLQAAQRPTLRRHGSRDPGAARARRSPSQTSRLYDAARHGLWLVASRRTAAT